MKALYTFWSKPLKENVCRCKSEKNFVLMFIYSMLWSAKWFQKVEMNTDDYGYNIFKYFESNNIKIKNTLNNFDNLDSYLFWAYPKLYSLTLQDEPFVHIDGDIFIFRKLKNELFEGDFGFQNRETTYYERTYNRLINFYDKNYLNKPIEWNPSLKSAINCGLMYFKDPTLAKIFHENIKKYFINIDKDSLSILKKELQEIINVTYITYPLLFEQYYINCFVNSFKNLKTNYLLSDEEIKKEEQGQSNIEGYVHLIEDKNNPYYINNISERFMIEFPNEWKIFNSLNLK